MQWFPSPGCTQFPGSAGQAQGPEGETDLEWPGSREVEAPSNVRHDTGCPISTAITLLILLTKGQKF